MASIVIASLAASSTLGCQCPSIEAAPSLEGAFLFGGAGLRAELLIVCRDGRLNIGNVAHVRNNPINLTAPAAGTTWNQHRAMHSVKEQGHALAAQHRALFLYGTLSNALWYNLANIVQGIAADGGGAGEAAGRGAAVRAYEENGAVVIRYENGFEEVRQGGTWSWRNNNPGNLVFGPFAKEHGAVGHAGGFAVFPSDAAGTAALAAWWRDPKRASLSLAEAMKAYAPPRDANAASIAFLVRQLGVPATTLVREVSGTQYERLLAVIRRYEGWKEGEVVWRRANQ